MNILGFFASNILAMSKNNVPWVSSRNPCCLPSAFFLLTPAIEKGWQGNPASKIS
jgi:hypothetical protein